MATLGVVVPNYNDSKTLERSIRAIVEQSRCPDRVLIIDDGSTDTSIEVIQDLERRFSIVEARFNGRNIGVNPSVNLGIEAVDTDYLHFSSANDCVMEGVYERLMDLLEGHPMAGLAYGAVELLRNGVSEIYRAPDWDHPLYVDPSEFYSGYLKKVPCFFSLSASVVYKRDALRRIGGFPPKLESYGDTFATNAVVLRHGAVYTPEVCARIYVSDTGYANSLLANRQAFLAMVEEAYGMMTTDPYKKVFPFEYAEVWRRNARRLGKGSALISFLRKSMVACDKVCSRVGISGKFVATAKRIAWRIFTQK